MEHRIPDQSHWPGHLVDRIVCADARDALRDLPDECVALAVTSPPYWNVVDYGVEGQIGQTSYGDYLDEMMSVWRETQRILIPNGKLAIVTPVMPIPKSQIGDQHTRHLKNIASDIEASILRELPGLHRFSLFVWKKQTTTKMFCSYPYPPNIYEDNTIEFINVYVKDGAPPPIAKAAKEPSKLTQAELAQPEHANLADVPGGRETHRRAPGAVPDRAAAEARDDVFVRDGTRGRLRRGSRSRHVQRHGRDNPRCEGHRQTLARHRPQPGLLRVRREPAAL